MIPKTNRLSRLDIDALKAVGVVRHTPTATFITQKNGVVDTKFAIVISKKTIKHATQRNKHKRRIFALLRSQLKNLPTQHTLIIPKKTTLIDFANNKELLAKNVRQA